jgi:hypothetical protein
MIGGGDTENVPALVVAANVAAITVAPLSSTMTATPLDSPANAIIVQICQATPAKRSFPSLLQPSWVLGNAIA